MARDARRMAAHQREFRVQRVRIDRDLDELSLGGRRRTWEIRSDVARHVGGVPPRHRFADDGTNDVASRHQAEDPEAAAVVGLPRRGAGGADETRASAGPAHALDTHVRVLDRIAVLVQDSSADGIAARNSDVDPVDHRARANRDRFTVIGVAALPEFDRSKARVGRRHAIRSRAQPSELVMSISIGDHRDRTERVIRPRKHHAGAPRREAITVNDMSANRSS